MDGQEESVVCDLEQKGNNLGELKYMGLRKLSEYPQSGLFVI